MLLLVWSVAPARLARADTLDEIRRRGALVWGADAEGGGPFVFPDPDSPTILRGFEVELAELLARGLGVKAEFHQGQWDKLPDLLSRGDIDLVLNGYEWTPAWGERFASTIPYYIYELQLLARADDKQLIEVDDLGKVVEGRRHKVAVLGGSAAETQLRRRFGDAVDLVLFDGNTDALRSVELTIDGIDSTVQDLPIAIFYQRSFPGLRRVGEPFSPGYYVGLARPDDQRLVAELNRILIQGLQDGSVRAILEHHGLWNRTQERRGLELDSSGRFAPRPVDDLGGEAPAVEPLRSWRAAFARLPLLAKAARMTIVLSVASMPLAILIGLGIAVLRMYGPTWLAAIAALYVEVVRGTPLVLQLYVIFFLLPELGLSLPPVVAAILGLAINYSAYEAEIYRAGLQAIPRGQLEAALSLGMSRGLAVRRIIVPQAVRIVIPPVTNDFIALFKDTAVCSVITVVELSKEYYIHARSTQAVVELGVLTAILYLAMSYPLSLLANYVERRMRAERRS